MEKRAAGFPLRTGQREWRIGLINGPNMSNLAYRDPGSKGPPQTIQQLEEWVSENARTLGMTVTPMHSNFDGEILEWVHDHAARRALDGILVNPAGLTTFGEHLRHCLAESNIPYVEVHYANIAKSDHKSIFTRTAAGTCYGFWKHSYTAGLVALASILDDEYFPKPKPFVWPPVDAQ